MTSPSIRASVAAALLLSASACRQSPLARVPAGPIVPGTISVLVNQAGGCDWERVSPDGAVVALQRIAIGSCDRRDVRFSSNGTAFAGDPAAGTDSFPLVVEPDGTEYEIRRYPLGDFLGRTGFTRDGEFGVHYTSVQGLMSAIERRLTGDDVERTYVWRGGRWKSVSADEPVFFFEEEEGGRQETPPEPDHGPYVLVNGDLYRNGDPKPTWTTPSPHRARFWPPVASTP